MCSSWGNPLLHVSVLVAITICVCICVRACVYGRVTPRACFKSASNCMHICIYSPPSEPDAPGPRQSPPAILDAEYLPFVIAIKASSSLCVSGPGAEDRSCSCLMKLARGSRGSARAGHLHHTRNRLHRADRIRRSIAAFFPVLWQITITTRSTRQAAGTLIVPINKAQLAETTFRRSPCNWQSAILEPRKKSDSIHEAGSVGVSAPGTGHAEGIGTPPARCSCCLFQYFSYYDIAVTWDDEDVLVTYPGAESLQIC